ncbi:hypothetical protein ACQY1Q_13225 [Tenacibaculum sp. TC6]|uniref:hypothetical protein n=1 Tax=Tenacibaculum sp. TC6 TaxID=3423223 RepID=UPI003D35AF32
MNAQQEIKLSSNWTMPGLYLSTLATLIFIPVAVSKIIKEGSTGAIVLGGLFFLLLIGLHIYLFKFLCVARVKNNKLVMKKLFKDAKEYTFDQIGTPKSLRIKNTVYTSVAMNNNKGGLEKFLIVNSKSLLSLNKIDAKATLMRLKEERMV